jgi:type IV pilus assembly protein PilN
MTTINLLPWRETLREERKQEFIVSLGVVVAVAVGVLFLSHLPLSAKLRF